ncbi:hypothetical protein E2C01_080915 [Portunus trituberculatus]|uniref:Uncharacterized protein n=1 Tax=Portunus trituberculatus TaxID=210409 RepID=A0A5B7INH4_PORTR|nr:hypothetical protein [Portunus trituberculatus]
MRLSGVMDPKAGSTLATLWRHKATASCGGDVVSNSLDAVIECIHSALCRRRQRRRRRGSSNVSVSSSESMLKLRSRRVGTCLSVVVATSPHQSLPSLCGRHKWSPHRVASVL